MFALHPFLDSFSVSPYNCQVKDIIMVLWKDPSPLDQGEHGWLGGW